MSKDVSPRLRIGEEGGVGGEEASSFGYEGVVVLVEALEAAGVHLHEGRLVGRAALQSEAGRVVGVQRGVGVAYPGEVVETVGEAGAVGSTYGVTSCTRNVWFVNFIVGFRRVFRSFRVSGCIVTRVFWSFSKFRSILLPDNTTRSLAVKFLEAKLAFN